MDWYPDSGETPLFRGHVLFATGRARQVEGMRWFRDEQGRDIGNEIPGWPSAKVPVRRGDKSAKAGRAFGVVGKVTGVLAVGVLEALSSGGGIGVGIGGSDGAEPENPALEVEDFPVLWAPPGTAARNAPWQLDPARRPKRYLAELVLTDRRLLVLGRAAASDPTEVLWQMPLNQVAGAQRNAYSTKGGDLTVAFVDGSWVRLDLKSPGRAAMSAWVLTGHTEPVVLTQPQQDWIGQHVKIGDTAETVAVPVADAPPGTLLIEVTRWAPKEEFYLKAGPYIMDAQAEGVHQAGK